MLRKIRFIDELGVEELSGKRVLLRIDGNVPLKKGKIADDFRLAKVVDTIEFLLDKETEVVLLTHLGRPDGKRVSKLSVKPIMNYFENKLNLSLCLLKEPKMPKTKNGKFDVYILENLRFFTGEEKNSKSFAKQLASLGDIYVNEAFSVSHREHASVVGITDQLNSYGGLLLQKELRVIRNLMEDPDLPFVAVLGGGKVKTKIAVINKLVQKANCVLIGGANLYPFFICAGLLKEENCPIDISKDVMKSVQNVWTTNSKKIILPVDIRAKINGKVKVMTNAEIQQWSNENKGKIIFGDVGPRTLSLFSILLRSAGTVYWNGPLGIYEEKKFAKGSEQIASMLGELGKGIIGGGDTVSICRKKKVVGKVNFVSTGGGASLYALSGEKLPGVEALKNSKIKNLK